MRMPRPASCGYDRFIMYLPKHFEESRPEVLQALVREHPLATLITQDRAGALQANPVPMLLDPPGDLAGAPPHGTLRGHVARANPLWRDTNIEVDALVVFQGAQRYISPSWYPSKAEHGKVVPTWNYIVVQARGRLRAIDDAAWLHAFVTRLTDRFEAAGSAPWKVSDAPDDYVASMLRAIVGIEIDIASIAGKWKVSQNRSDADQAGVAAGLASLDNAEANAMAAAVASASRP